MRGALFMSVSMAGFTINDSIVKTIMGSMNMGQVMLVRGAFACLLMGTLAWRSGALKFPKQALHPLVALRALCELFATVSYLAALAHMPLGNVSAVMQALPLAVAMGAALFLGEMVGWRRWLAIIAGFAGVMIIVRPGFEGFSVYSLLALVSVAFAAARDIITRIIPNEIPSMLISTMTSIGVMLTGGVLIMPLGGWSPLTSMDLVALAGAAVLLMVGYHFIILGMREGEISFVAPFRYTSLLWAILLGYLLFADVPDVIMITGATIVVSSGIYTLYREKVVGKHKPTTESVGPSMGPDGL